MDICGSTNCCTSNNPYERFGLSTNVSNQYSCQWSIKVKCSIQCIICNIIICYILYAIYRNIKLYRIRLNYPAISDILSGGDANDVLRCQQEDLVHLGRVCLFRKYRHQHNIMVTDRYFVAKILDITFIF